MFTNVYLIGKKSEGEEVVDNVSRGGMKLRISIGLWRDTKSDFRI